MKSENVHTDAELIAIVRKNKKDAGAAFEAMYDRYSDKIYRYILLSINSTDAASDILQEVFIAFYKKLHEYDIDNVSAFLYAVARNHIYKFITRTVKLPTLDNCEFLVYSDDEIKYESEELFNMVINTLSTLENIYKDVYILREFNGLSYREIAEILNITESAAKTRVHRAQLKLKQILSPIINELSSI